MVMYVLQIRYAGLSCLASLMELYCGGNQIEGVREVGHLKGLPKLIILDLTGNPVAAQDDYRLYTVYHLRKLKVNTLLPFPCQHLTVCSHASKLHLLD